MEHGQGEAVDDRRVWACAPEGELRAARGEWDRTAARTGSAPLNTIKEGPKSVGAWCNRQDVGFIPADAAFTEAGVWQRPAVAAGAPDRATHTGMDIDLIGKGVAWIDDVAVIEGCDIAALGRRRSRRSRGTNTHRRCPTLAAIPSACAKWKGPASRPDSGYPQLAIACAPSPNVSSASAGVPMPTHTPSTPGTLKM